MAASLAAPTQVVTPWEPASSLGHTNPTGAVQSRLIRDLAISDDEFLNFEASYALDPAFSTRRYVEVELPWQLLGLDLLIEHLGRECDNAPH